MLPGPRRQCRGRVARPVDNRGARGGVSCGSSPGAVRMSSRRGRRLGAGSVLLDPRTPVSPRAPPGCPSEPAAPLPASAMSIILPAPPPIAGGAPSSGPWAVLGFPPSSHRRARRDRRSPLGCAVHAANVCRPGGAPHRGDAGRFRRTRVPCPLGCARRRFAAPGPPRSGRIGVWAAPPAPELVPFGGTLRVAACTPQGS